MASGAILASTYYAKRYFGASQASLGFFALVSAGTYVVASLIFGRLSDRWGRRRNICLACAIDVIAFALIPYAEQLWQLYALICLFAVGQGAFWPALEADISDNSRPEELPRRLGRFNVAWCSGFAVAGLVAGPLGQYYGELVVMAGSACIVVLALVVYLGRTFEPEDVPALHAGEFESRRAAKRVKAFWIIALVLNCAATGLNASMRYHMPAVTGGGQSALGGLLQAVVFIFEVLTFIVLARWTGWHYRASPLAIGCVAALAGGVLCGLSPYPGSFAVGCALTGVGCGVIYYSSIYYSVATGTGRGARGGIHESVLGSGTAMVPWIGGLLAVAPWAGGRLSWPAGTPFLSAAVILALAVIISAFIYMRVRNAHLDDKN